jgi:hypothetical protein
MNHLHFFFSPRKYKGCSVSTVPYVIKIRSEVITMLNVLYLFHLSTIIIPVHTDASVPSWRKFKNTIMVEIRLLHVQPFMNSHFHFFITVELATSQVLLQRLKQMEVWRGKVRTTGLLRLYDFRIWLTLAPFGACYPYQVLPSTKKQNASLTQQLQAREPYLLNTLHKFSTLYNQ